MRTVAVVLMMATILLQAAPAQTSEADLAAYVNPFIGTAPAPATGYGLEFDGGDTFPGAVYPSGMLAWSPDTVEHRIPGGYFYPDQSIKGFSLTHFSGRGCTAYQDVPIMPIAGVPSASPRVQPPVATFSHADESASPGDYALTLDNGIALELTATPRTGLGSVTFPSGTGTLLIDAGGSVNDVFDSQVNVDADRHLVTGSVQTQVGCGTDKYTLYFAIVFDQPFTAYGTWSEDQLQPGVVSADAAHTGAYVSVDSAVHLKPALSYVSVDNALANLAAENPGWDVATVRDSARSAWNDVLRSVDVHGGADADRQTFYTALYHAFLHPNVFSDANGEYIGFDDQVHQVAAGHAHYANIPGWDEYRSLIQLRAILAPAQTSDIIQSLVDDATQGGGGMPRWEQANRNSAGMVGDSPGAYVASAYAFGAREFDTSAALAALDYGASVPGAASGGHVVREFGEPWLSLGYVPEQPSITLEYATDDFAIGQFASALGRDDVGQLYAARAVKWANTLDPSTGYAAPRSASGTFERVAPEDACCGFVEGNAAQYTWMVPFDFAGLFGRMGGAAVAVSRLDAFFAEVNAGPNRPNMWIGNEPSLATPWAYDFAGAPDRTQSVVRRIQTTAFAATPAGLPGNDDGGALSAWYVFAALGLYPAVPGVGGFAIGSPSFASIDVHLAGGKLLRITNTSATAIAALNVDGAPYGDAWIDWSRVAGGATLEFGPA